MSSDLEPEKYWHLDKRVPIAIIVALFFQSASAFWFASNLSTRVEVLERRVDNQNRRIEVVDDAIHRLEVGLTSVGEKLNFLIDYLQEELEEKQ
jgi:uncharacterized coiled-coil protein SlyX